MFDLLSSVLHQTLCYTPFTCLRQMMFVFICTQPYTNLIYNNNNNNNNIEIVFYLAPYTTEIALMRLTFKTQLNSELI